MKQRVRTRLRILRDRSRLTLQEVATLTGMDMTTVSKHESGSRGMDGNAISAYAKLYKVQTHELFELGAGLDEE